MRPADALGPFVPRLVREGPLATSELPTGPALDRFEGCVLFTDVTGFTLLTDELAERGEGGAEIVQGLLNDCFGGVIDTVLAHGGEVPKFAGDATLALWRRDGVPLAELVAEVSAVAVRIQDDLARHPTSLRVRAGVAAGPLWAARVGGVGGRWEALLGGRPIAEVGEACARAEPGTVVLAPSAAALLGDVPWCTPAAAGHRVVSGGPAAPPPRRRDEPRAAAHLRAYVPRAVLARLDAGFGEWLAEFRQATVLFAESEGHFDSDVVEVDTLQYVTRTMQSAVHRHAGSVNQLLVGDRGTLLVAGWGLPTHAHEDDALRAVSTALEIRSELRASGIDTRAGVASGRIFVGHRGSPQRVEYGMIGSTVNLAARLMGAAADVLIDGATRAATSARIPFEEPFELSLKGVQGSVSAHRPRGGDDEADRSRVTALPSARLVGRDDVAGVLRREVEACVTGDGVRTLLVEGEAGIGKSRVLGELLRLAEDSALTIRLVEADSLGRTTAYLPWRRVARRVLGLSGAVGLDAVEAALRERLGDGSDAAAAAALIGPVLDPALATDDVPSTVDARSRARAVRDLLADVIASDAPDKPTLLVLEDAHWLDSASWALALAVSRRKTPLLVAIVTRPLPEHVPEEGRRLVEGADEHLRLTPLDEEGTLALVQSQLGVGEVPGVVARTVWARSRGHPLYAEQLVSAMVERGAVTIEGDRCFVDHAALERVSAPDSLHTLLASRVDRLTPQEQLSLKVASTIGARFDLETLRAAHPIGPAPGVVHAEMSSVRDLGLVVADETEGSFRFGHAVTQEVVYGLLPFGQRQQLHGAVATHLESTGHDDAPILAHHWKLAGDGLKAFRYFDVAAERALEQYANEEAATFLRELLELDADLDGPGVGDHTTHVERGVELTAREARRVRWLQKLGRCEVNMGRFEEGGVHLQEALRLLRQSSPEGGGRLLRDLLGGLVRQTYTAFRPRGIRIYTPEAGAIMVEAARAHLALSGVYYHRNRGGASLNGVVAAVNIAQRSGPTPELAMSAAYLVMGAGAFGLHRAARRYVAMAHDTARVTWSSPGTAKVLTLTSIYRLAAGDWSALEELGEAIELSDEVGDIYQWEESTYIHALACSTLGRFHESDRCAADTLASAERSDVWLHRVWAHRARAEAQLRLGALDEAVTSCERALALIEGARDLDRASKIQVLGLLAVAQLRRGDLSDAVSNARRAVAELEHGSFIGYNAVAWLAGPTEVLVEAWERGGVGGDTDEIATLARRACAMLIRHARRYEPGKVRALLWRGRREWLLGREARARRYWQSSWELAASLFMPYDVAVARLELGRRAGASDPGRGRHLEAAAEAFEEMGAAYDMLVARAALEG